MAKRDLLLFLHADCALPTDGIAQISAACAQHPLAWGRFDVRIQGVATGLAIIAWFMNQRSRLTGIATGDQGIFMTRAAFDAVDGFPQLPLMEDVAISRLLKQLAAPICLRARIQTSGRRWEKHGIWRTMVLMWRLRFDYWRGVSAGEICARYYPLEHSGPLQPSAPRDRPGAPSPPAKPP